MTRKKRLLRAAGCLVVAAASTTYADTSIQGFYTGLSLGLQDAAFDWKTTVTYAPAGNVIGPSSDTTKTLSDSTASAGIFVGYNLMLGNDWLTGIEVGYVPGKLDDMSIGIPGLGQPNIPSSYINVEAEDYTSVGVRLGRMLAPTLMVYGSLNYLQARVEATATCPADTTVCNPADGTRAGGGGRTVDGTGLSLGVEKALTPNFMIRGQYQYSQYEAADLIVLPYINGSSFGAEAEVELNSDTFEIGAAYLL